MNLKDIRTQVMEISDWSPDNLAYKVFVDRAINMAILNIWMRKPWIFSYKETYLDLISDITSEQGGGAINVLNMSRKVSFANPVYDFQNDPRTFQGQTMEIEGKDYKIQELIDIDTLYLSEPFRTQDGTASATTTDWKIKHAIYRLPEDCIKLETFFQSDRPVNAITPREADSIPIVRNNLYQSSISGSYATHICLEEDLKIPAGDFISVQQFNETNADCIPDGQWCEFAWAFQYANHYGPLSDFINFKVDGGADDYSTLQVSMISRTNRGLVIPTRDELDTPYPSSPREGYHKVLFQNINIDVNTGKRLGLPCWVPVLDFDPDGSQNEYRPLRATDQEDTIEVAWLGCLTPSNDRYIPGSIKQIRPYPRIADADLLFPHETIDGYHEAPKVRFKQALIQYQYRPQELCLDEDESELPNEFHQLIIYKALEDVFNKKGQPELSQVYVQKFERELTGLFQRYSVVQTHHLSRRSVRTGSTLFQIPTNITLRPA